MKSHENDMGVRGPEKEYQDLIGDTGSIGRRVRKQNGGHRVEKGVVVFLRDVASEHAANRAGQVVY